jgi:hypothetical protein
VSHLVARWATIEKKAKKWLTGKTYFDKVPPRCLMGQRLKQKLVFEN